VQITFRHIKTAHTTKQTVTTGLDLGDRRHAASLKLAMGQNRLLVLLVPHGQPFPIKWRRANKLHLNTLNSMSKKLYKSTPPMKVGEFSIEQGGGSYIYFEECVNIPGLEDADISIRFERNNSFAEVQKLVHKMKDMGFVFAVQK